MKMKNLFTKKCLLILSLLFFCFGGNASLYAQFSGGDGSAAAPYQISTADQLNQVRNNLSSYFILNDDIDLSAWLASNSPSQGWNPIGNVTTPFSGTFDGKGHAISGFWINRPTTNYAGLFGYISGSNVEIKNIGLLISSQKIIAQNQVGGIVGFIADGSTVTIQSSYVQGSIAAGGHIGALLGRNGNSTLTITNSYASKGTVAGTWNSGLGTSSGPNVGGLIGTINAGATATITFSYSSDTLTNTGLLGASPNPATGVSGGIIGSAGGSAAQANITITNCVAANPSIAGPTGSGVGRVIGYFSNINSTFENYAYTDMSVNGAVITTGVIGNKGGLNKPAADLSSAATYSDFGWDFTNVWQIGDGQLPFTALPVLKNQSVLPVRLASFTGNGNGSVNVLQWHTTFEENNKGFVVLRSLDGNGFDSLSFVPARKVSTGSHYEYQDRAPLKGNNLYRLQIVDLDGSVSYSPIVRVSGTQRLGRLLLYPNPAKDRITIEYPVPVTQGYLQITDISGKIVRQLAVSKQASVSVVNIGNLPLGVYFIVADGYKISFVKQ